ncbi:hypothetical protein KHQ81_06460 [Mycoplasmatota bacterium]|nr:hypothetical protein KHQ81_06460 [Mycoplasmatota bacterium]
MDNNIEIFRNVIITEFLVLSFVLYFCQMAARKKNNTSIFKDFLLFCMRFNPELHEKNNSGKNIYDIVNTFGILN